MEVTQSSVIDKVTVPAFLVVQTIVEVCQLRFLQSVVEYPGVRQSRIPTVQKTDEMPLVRSIDTLLLLAQSNASKGQTDPEDDRSPASVEHCVGRGFLRSQLLERRLWHRARLPHTAWFARSTHH